MSETTPDAAPQSAPEAQAQPVSYLDAARAKLASVSATQPAEASPEAPQDAAQRPRTAADYIIDGPQEEPPPAAPEAPAGADADALARIVELDRAARLERQQLEESRRALEQRERELAAWQQASQAKESGDLGAVLSALGLSYDDLTSYMLTGKSTAALPKDVAELRAELARLQDELPKQYEEKLAEAQRQRDEAAKSAWLANTSAQLRSAGERWGLLTDPTVTGGREAADIVYETMERHYTDTGEMLSVEAAADMLEDAYEERARKSLASSKLARILGGSGISPDRRLNGSPTPSPESGHSPTKPSGLVAPSLTTSALAERGAESKSDFSPSACVARAHEMARARLNK